MREIRAAALDAACRISPTGEDTRGVLSRARQLETYLETGIVRHGDRDGTTVHVAGLAITISAPLGHLKVSTVGQIRAAIEEALR